MPLITFAIAYVIINLNHAGTSGTISKLHFNIHACIAIHLNKALLLMHTILHTHACIWIDTYRYIYTYICLLK